MDEGLLSQNSMKFNQSVSSNTGSSFSYVYNENKYNNQEKKKQMRRTVLDNRIAARMGTKVNIYQQHKSPSALNYSHFEDPFANKLDATTNSINTRGSRVEDNQNKPLLSPLMNKS